MLESFQVLGNLYGYFLKKINLDFWQSQSMGPTKVDMPKSPLLSDSNDVGTGHGSSKNGLSTSVCPQLLPSLHPI